VEVKGLLIGGGASGLGDGAATNAFKVDDGVGCLAVINFVAQPHA